MDEQQQVEPQAEPQKNLAEKTQDIQMSVDNARSFVDWLKDLWQWVKGLFGKQ